MMPAPALCAWPHASRSLQFLTQCVKNRLLVESILTKEKRIVEIMDEIKAVLRKAAGK